MTHKHRSWQVARAAFGLVAAVAMSYTYGTVQGMAYSGAWERPSTMSAARSAASAPAAAYRGMRMARACAESYGDFWIYPDYYDPTWECLLDLSAADLAQITNRIQQFEDVCSAEALFLYNATLYEWTGNYSEGYEWEGFINYAHGYVAMHWTSFDEWYMWAHEGAHGTGHYTEASAIDRGEDCTDHLYPY